MQGLIRENYVLAPGSDREIRVVLDQLSDFIQHSDQHFEKQSADLTKLSVIEIAFKHFNALENQTQVAIFQVTEYLTQYPQDCCFDQLTRLQYKKIVSIWTRFTYLQTAINQVCVFLTPLYATSPLTEEELDRTQCIISFAIKYFKELDDQIKISLHHLAFLIKNPLLEKSLSQQKHYLFFVKNLKNLPPLDSSPNASEPFSILTFRESIPLPPSTFDENKRNPFSKFIKKVKKPDLSLKEFEDDCSFMSGEVSNHQEQEWVIAQTNKEAQQKEATQPRQVEKICRLSHEIFQYYFPLSWLGTVKDRQQLMKDFDQRYPVVAKELFFSQQSSVSSLQFKIIHQVLEQAVQFLRLLKDKDSVLLQMPKEDVNKILETMLDSAFDRWQPKASPLNSFISFLAVNSSLQLINYFLNPDSFYFILERLLSSEPWDTEDFNSTKIPLSQFRTEKELTKLFANVLEALGKELIDLGEPEWSAKIASKTLLQVIKFKKEALAEKIQQILRQIKSSPCSMMPLLVTHRLLFQKDHNNKLQTAWFTWQTLDPTVKASRKQTIEKDVSHRLYETLMAEIKQTSNFAGWLVNNASSVEKFCQTLSQRLWTIFKNEETIKFLVIYLLKGVEKVYIEAQKENV